MTTVYTVKDNGITFQTTDSDEAARASENGASVKATHHVDLVTQTEDDPGTLVMAHNAEWTKHDGPQLVAGPDGWQSLEDMR